MNILFAFSVLSSHLQTSYLFSNIHFQTTPSWSSSVFRGTVLLCNFMLHKLAEILLCLLSLAACVPGAATVRLQVRAAPNSSRANRCEMSATYSSLDHTSPVKAFMFKACTFPPHIFQIKFSEVVMMFCLRPCRFFLHGNSEGNHSPHFHSTFLLFIKRYCE